MRVLSFDPFFIMDREVYNDSGANILRGEAVTEDPTPGGVATEATAKNIRLSSDPFASNVGVFDGLALVNERLIAVEKCPAQGTAGLRQIVGVALHDIPNGEYGIVRVCGPCLAKVTDTATKANRTAYGAGTTAGQLTDSPAADASARWVAALQIDASGATSAGDLRKVVVVAVLNPNAYLTGVVTPNYTPWGQAIL